MTLCQRYETLCRSSEQAQLNAPIPLPSRALATAKPPRERKVRDRYAYRPLANDLLTTVVDACILDAEMPEQVIWPDQADCGGLTWTRAFS